VYKDCVADELFMTSTNCRDYSLSLSRSLSCDYYSFPLDVPKRRSLPLE